MNCVSSGHRSTGYQLQAVEAIAATGDSANDDGDKDIYQLMVTEQLSEWVFPIPTQCPAPLESNKKHCRAGPHVYRTNLVYRTISCDDMPGKLTSGFPSILRFGDSPLPSGIRFNEVCDNECGQPTRSCTPEKLAVSDSAQLDAYDPRATLKLCDSWATPTRYRLWETPWVRRYIWWS